MGKVFGIDLGTTYSCIAHIDENGKPVVLKNAEGDLTTPSAVFFETQTDITVGSAAKESAKMYPEQVVTFIKRSIGQPGFSLNLNGIDMKPEEISSYILKKVVKDAEDSLRMEGNPDYFTIIPTTNCNARCFYCYESCYDKETMTDETISGLSEYITENIKGPFVLDLYGGEPLLCVDKINKLLSISND